MISFIISAKNEEHYIGSCLTSILKQATVEAYEIIVVDNGSADRTAEVARQNCPQVRIIQEAEPGTNAARQRGSLESRGEWLIFLDADVRLPDKDWLSRALAKIHASKNIVAISTHYRYYDLPFFKKALQTIGTFGFIYPWLFVVNNLLRITATMIGGMMIIKKDALIQAGGFSSSGQFYGDEVSIAIKLYKLGRIKVSPSLWVWTSGRRFNRQGMAGAVFKYVLNYFWVLFTGKPHDRSGYREFR